MRTRETSHKLSSTIDWLNVLLEFSTDGIHIVNSHGNLILCSDSFVSMLGYTHEETAALSVFDWDAKIPEKELYKILPYLLENPSTFETRHRRKDGSLFDVEITSKPIVLEGKKYIYASSRDITEQIEFRHTIENDRERFRAIAELGADWFWESDEQGRYTRISANVEKTLGYSAKELLGKPLFDFISSETLKQQFHSAMDKSQTFNDMTVLAIKKDGSEVFLETSGTPILDKNGHATGYRGIDRDITEKKLLEIKLIEHNTELNTIFDTSKDGIVIVDFETNFLDFNDAFVRITGYTPAELLHKSCLDLTPAEEIENSVEILRLIQEGKEVKDFEKTLVDKEGKHHTISFSLALMPDHKRILANLKDITEQKAKSNELSELYDRLRLATDAADIGIWVWNLKDNSLVWDEKMYEIYEISPELQNSAVSYDDWKNSVHPDDIENAEHELQSAVHTMSPFDTSFRIIVPDGTVKYIQTSSVVKRDPRGKALTMIGINRDVTADRTLKEALIEAKEAAENANKAKSDFLANMSHEIRTPLNGIIGLTDLVLQSDLNPLQRDYLTKSERSAEALLNVLNGILDYSKIEVHKLRLESIPFDLHEMLDNLNALFSYKAEEKQIDLIFNVDPDVPNCLVGDPLRLMQILSNLVGNALKFTDSGSVTITITALNKGQNPALQFKVADTGIGMTPEQQKNLFDPFYQADSSITRKYGGTGLGLMISKELILLMGGEITLSSTLYEGTVFTFTADFKTFSDSGSPVSLSSAALEKNDLFPPFGALRILLVEDNDLNQLVATERLKQMGLSVSVANNGLEAVEMLKRNDFDAILMDLQMPVMDGFEASRQIRALEGKKHIPIIALSAAVMQEDRKLAMEAGMNDHISKPIDKVLLHRILTKWLIV